MSQEETKIREPLAERYAAERCYVSEWWNDDGDEAVSLARVRVEPGVSTELHRLLDTTERYLILSGRGCMETGARVREMGPGDVEVIAAEESQRITNIGNDWLVFLAVCTPRFRQHNYEAVAEPDS